MRVDLRTTYLGLELKNPVVAAASPLTGRLDALIALQNAGVSAVTLPSLFEEQIEHNQAQLQGLSEIGTDTFAEALGGYFPDLDRYHPGPRHYLEHLSAAVRNLSIPVIASLNGVSPGGWVYYAKEIQNAGAHALELNLYVIPANPDESSQEVEERYLSLVRMVREALSIPLAVKISPFFSAPIHMARRLSEAGANGLVLFNRFVQPRIHLETLELQPDLKLSSSHELRLPLRWIALMKGRVPVSLAATSGVHTALNVAELLLAGADVATFASAFIRNGPDYASQVLDGLEEWLFDHEYESVTQVKGSFSQENCPDPAAFERAHYMNALVQFTNNL